MVSYTEPDTKTMWKITPNAELIEIPATNNSAKPDDIVWVPIDTLAFFQPEMPTRRKKLWHQTVPFALEDELIDSIDQLHFALGKTTTQQVPTIVVSRAQLDDWLQLAEEQQIEPRMLVPELYALPYASGQLTIWHENGRCLLRDGNHSGYAGSVEWIAGLVSLQFHNSQLEIYSDNFEALPEAWQKDARPLSELLEQRMGNGVSGEAINLLQGVYQVGSMVTTYLPIWRWAIALALIAFTAHISLLIFDTNRYDHYSQLVRGQSLQLIEQLQIPSDTSLDLRMQVAHYIQQFVAYDERRRDNAWAILVQVERLISNCKLCRVETLELDADMLSLEMSSTENIQDLHDKLERLPNFTVKYEKLPADSDGRSRARFVLTEQTTKPG